MSVKRSMTVAALAIGAVLMAGGTAHAEQSPTTEPMSAAKAPSAGSAIQIGAGRTDPGVGWVAYNTNGISLDVDTSSANFAGTPVYLISLGGIDKHFQLTGANAVYGATAKSFRVYLRYSDWASLTPADAKTRGWFVNWVGVTTP
ncbi:hypothetical protein ACOZ38_12520 [Sphaerisporangium viridialbum]|uniref:hypothetical protein n=1 Tax=Sphaerisporangium viridialbum TaxID=46189 RepID=UPI003C73D37E